jgi:hypothetical protein
MRSSYPVPIRKQPEGAGLTGEAEFELAQLVESLNRRRRALALAKAFNRPVLTADRHGIQNLLKTIRRHCAEHGLELPSEVSETREGEN